MKVATSASAGGLERLAGCRPCLRQCAAYPLLGSAPGSVAHSRAQGAPQTGQADRTDDVLQKADRSTCYQQVRGRDCNGGVLRCIVFCASELS